MTYQLRHFMLHAAGLLAPELKVAAVTYEHSGLDAIDDLLVEYGQEGVFDHHQGFALTHDGYQVKYHVDPDGDVTAGALAEPAWIGTKKSLLARFAEAWGTLQSEGHRPRLRFVTTWQIPKGDPLREVLRQRRVDPDRLLRSSAAKKVRDVAARWQAETGLDDPEFRAFLLSIEIHAGAPSLEELSRQLALMSPSVGLRAPDPALPQNEYDALARAHLESGRPRRFDREGIETLFEQAGLRAVPKVDFASTATICAFEPWTTVSPESMTNVLIDLRDLFDGRAPKSASVWGDDVVQRLLSLPAQLATLPQPVLLAVEAHLSIAFGVGSVFAKSGVPVRLQQKRTASLELWDPAAAGGQPAHIATHLDASSYPGAPLAVAISVSRDAEPDARAHVAAHVPEASFLDLRVEIGQNAVRDAGHAVALAAALDDEIGRTVRALRPQSTHLFPACPWALAFMLGQRSHDWGPTTIYEFDFGGPIRRYSPALTLPLTSPKV